MAIFGRSHATETEPAVPAKSEANYVEPQRRSGLFGSRRRSNTPVRDGHTNGTNTSPRRGLLHRSDAPDSSIIAARERVMGAEAAERDADRALLQARAAVREARDHVKRLEREAAEEARLAKIKQNQAKSLSNRAKPLGRHDRV